MQLFNLLLTLASVAQAHYDFDTFSNTATPNASAPAWQYTRQWYDYYAYTPVVNVSAIDIRCNVNGTAAFAPGILTAAAGSVVSFAVQPDIFHPGPLMAYMAKVPSGYTAANWDGSGTVWFKIFEEGPIFPTVGSNLAWYSDSKSSHIIWSQQTSRKGFI